MIYCGFEDVLNSAIVFLSWVFVGFLGGVLMLDGSFCRGFLRRIGRSSRLFENKKEILPPWLSANAIDR